MKQLFINYERFDNLKCNLEDFLIVRESFILDSKHYFYLVNNKDKSKEEIYFIDYEVLYKSDLYTIQDIINEKIKESKTYKFLQLNEKINGDTETKRKVKI